MSDHAHWVWQCRFNPSHDQLLLTGSSDATVKLHHIPKLGKSGAKPATEPTPGSHQWQASEASCCAAFDGHDDSIYGEQHIPLHLICISLDLEQDNADNPSRSLPPVRQRTNIILYEVSGVCTSYSKGK